MATCKDCMHYDLCRSCSRIQLGWNVNTVGYVENVEEICKHFADRSRFVELPCVGDKVYELCRINQFGDYKIVESEIRGFIVDTNGTAFDYELLGERFFLTHEEAEQALKECEK